MSVINTNITSMIGQSNLSKSQNALQTSMERLSSGCVSTVCKAMKRQAKLIPTAERQITGWLRRSATLTMVSIFKLLKALNQVNITSACS